MNEHVRTVRATEEDGRPFICSAQLHFSEESIRLLAQLTRFRRLGPCFDARSVERLDLVALVAENRGKRVWPRRCVKRQRPQVYRQRRF